jgi:uncharacterized phiE125 gp8 family phage protein
MQNYNHVYQVKDITDVSGDPVEPVQLDEVKSYLRLEGFQDVDESDITEFDDDDDLIETLIVTARKKLEKLYGISIVEKTLRAVITNLAGDIEIPQGPVISITSLKNSEGDDITDYTITGYTTDELEEDINDFVTLECPNQCKMVMVYEAGYVQVPEPLKVEILRMVAWYFTNRGDVSVRPSLYGFDGFQYLTGEYNRNSWLA